MQSKSTEAWPYPRAPQACDRCKVSKVKCTREQRSTQPSCKRCVQKGYACVYQRHSKSIDNSDSKRKRKNDASRQHGSAASMSISSLGRSIGQHVPLDSTTCHEEIEAIRNFHQDAFHSHLHSLPSNRRLTSLTDQLSSIPSPNSTAMHLLSDNDIGLYLQRYESIYHYFPFLPLPMDWSVACMKQDHPFFLLGVLSAMTHAELSLNSQLHAQFLRVLAGRVVADGEKHLDILQGMLVQIAWYPMHLNPRRRHIFQILQLAIEMIRDLGLDPNGMDPTASQVVLACNFVSDIISVAFGRPNNFPTNLSNDSLLPAILNGTPITPANVHIYFAVRAQWPSRIVRDPDLDLEALVDSANAMNNELDFVAFNLESTAFWTTATILSKLYAESQISAIPLLAPHDAFTSMTARDGSFDCQVILTSLERCLHTVKAFFTTLLALPQAAIRDLSFVQWAQLVQVLKVAPKLCFPVASLPAWNAAQARDELRLDLVLDSLCYRMGELTTSDDQRGLQPDHPLMFKSMLKLLKSVYDERLKALENEKTPSSSSKATSCPMLNGSLKTTEFWDALNSTSELTADTLVPDLDIDLFDLSTFQDPAEDWLDLGTIS